MASELGTGLVTLLLLFLAFLGAWMAEKWLRPWVRLQRERATARERAAYLLRRYNERDLETLEAAWRDLQPKVQPQPSTYGSIRVNGTWGEHLAGSEYLKWREEHE